MGFIGRLGKQPRVRANQAKEARRVFKRALHFSPHSSSKVLPNKRKRPPETKEEVAYWLSKSNDKASEKQFFVRPVRPNRPFRTLPPRLVPAGALLYIVPAFLGGYNFILLMAFVHTSHISLFPFLTQNLPFICNKVCIYFRLRHSHTEKACVQI